jgi:chorismate-pyruvate lyase
MLDPSPTVLRIWSADTFAADPQPTLFQKVLLVTDGTVTELLSMYAGQPIRARKLGQSLDEVAAPAGLDARAGERVLHRTVMLEPPGPGDTLFAESFFVFDLFSASLQRRLIETEAPIGLLWREERLEMFREVVERRIERSPPVARLLKVPEATALFSRTYSISHAGRVLGLITEKFAATAFL